MKHVESTSIWQTPEWEAFQEALQHKTIHIDGNRGIINPLPGGFSYLYIPRGTNTISQNMWKNLTQLAEKEQLVFTRIDPIKPADLPDKVRSTPSHSPQPETTRILDLSLTEQELLQQMKRKGRYNISLAEKKGVQVSRIESEAYQQGVGEFYRLLVSTTERDAFSGHNKEYYSKMLKHLPQASLFTAYVDEQPIASAILVLHGEDAIYYYGASGDEKREYMAPYLLQWKMMLYAKKQGCTRYDLLGVAPEDAPADHPWAGISSFKKKFGGEVIQYPQAVDLIHRPFAYKCFKILKALQKLIKS